MLLFMLADKFIEVKVKSYVMSTMSLFTDYTPYRADDARDVWCVETAV